MPELRKTPHFDWTIHYRCRNDCSYCWFHGTRPDDAAYRPSSAVLDAWRRVREKHGECEISIGGGEPLLYPDFTALCAELTRMHKISIATALSDGISALAKNAKPGNLEVSASFHPESARLEEFLSAAAAAKESGVLKRVWVVAWPPFLGKLAGYASEFSRIGVEMKVYPFWGEHLGAQYPAAYTQEQRRALSGLMGTREGEPFVPEPKKTKGRICLAGKLHAIVNPNGDVFRCGSENFDGKAKAFGNLYRSGFSLLDAAAPCPAPACRCNEWAGLLS